MMLTETQCGAAVRYNERRNYSTATVSQIQELLEVSTTGTWNVESVQAVARWQEEYRLEADGMVGPTTLQAMKDEVAGEISIYPVMHPLPTITSMWGYDHCPDTYKKPCPAWHAATREPTFVNGLLRLVSGGTDDRDRFSRSPDSWISLDEFSIGIAHWWADTAPKVLSRIARECPGVAAHAWGTTAVPMRDEEWLRAQIQAKRGKRPHQAKYDWLLAGWWEIGQHPEVVELCARQWVQDYTPAGLVLMKKYGWRRGTSLAGLVRVTNSRGSGGMKSLVQKAITRADTDDEHQVLPVLFSDEVYGHPERWEIITSLPHFKGRAPTNVSLDGFHIDRDLVLRVDGTVPKWIAAGL